MRIGEIAIVGPNRLSVDKFVRAVSNEVEIQNDSLTFGRFDVNNQLLLHLYGLQYSSKNLKPAWDLVSRKLLGYVYVFDWHVSGAYSQFSEAIDTLTERYRLPFVIAAATHGNSNGISRGLAGLDLTLADQTKITFCQLDDPESVRNVLLILLNILLERMPQ